MYFIRRKNLLLSTKLHFKIAPRLLRAYTMIWAALRCLVTRNRSKFLLRLPRSHTWSFCRFANCWTQYMYFFIREDKVWQLTISAHGEISSSSVIRSETAMYNNLWKASLYAFFSKSQPHPSGSRLNLLPTGVRCVRVLTPKFCGLFRFCGDRLQCTNGCRRSVS